MTLTDRLDTAFDGVLYEKYQLANSAPNRAPTPAGRIASGVASVAVAYGLYRGMVAVADEPD